MTEQKFSKIAKKLVLDWYAKNHPEEGLELGAIYIVWMCKTLQNNKAMLSTPIEDGRYFEVTHNGDKGEIYLDAYKKEDNTLIYSSSYSE